MSAGTKVATVVVFTCGGRRIESDPRTRDAAELAELHRIAANITDLPELELTVASDKVYINPAHVDAIRIIEGPEATE